MTHACVLTTKYTYLQRRYDGDTVLVELLAAHQRNEFIASAEEIDGSNSQSLCRNRFRLLGSHPLAHKAKYAEISECNRIVSAVCPKGACLGPNSGGDVAM